MIPFCARKMLHSHGILSGVHCMPLRMSNSAGRFQKCFVVGPQEIFRIEMVTECPNKEVWIICWKPHYTVFTRPRGTRVPPPSRTTAGKLNSMRIASGPSTATKNNDACQVPWQVRYTHELVYYSRVAEYLKIGVYSHE